MARKGEKDKEQKLVVEKRKVVNEASWFDPKKPTWENPITKQAYFFFLLYLSKINPRDPNTKSLVISSGEYKDIMHFHHLNHEQISKAVSLLFDLKIVIPDTGVNGSVFHVFEELKYEKDPEIGKFIFKFVPNMKVIPYIFDYNNNYLTYDLKNVIALTSLHQIRFYELLKQNEFKGKFPITVKALKHFPYIDADEYAEFKELKNCIIDPCQKKLAEFTDIKFTYAPEHTGEHGKILSLQFTIATITKAKKIAPPPPEPEAEACPQSAPAPEAEAAPGADVRAALGFIKENFSLPLLARIYDRAGGDISLVKRAYEYAKSQKNCKSFYGLLMHVIDNPEKIYRAPEKEPERNRFANFNQRKNDFDELERLALEQLIRGFGSDDDDPDPPEEPDGLKTENKMDKDLCHAFAD